MMENAKEIWKPYPEIDFIQGSNLGRVRTLDRYVKQGNGKRFVKGHILSQHRDKNGYMHVSFNVNGKVVNLRVHRIIASCFLQNPDNLSQINHKDCARDDNRVDNLEYCTASYNRQYTEKYGEAQGHPVYAINLNTWEILRFESQHEAAQRLGCNLGNISGVLKGKLKQTKGYLFTEDEDEITKKKIQEIKDGMWCKYVLAINLDTFEVLQFESQHEVKRQLGIYQSSISKVIKGEQKTAGGYWFTNKDKNAVEATRSKFGDEVAGRVSKLIGV